MGAKLNSRERQEAYRAKQALLGLREVRGIYLPEQLHKQIKEYARFLLEQSQKDDKKD